MKKILFLLLSTIAMYGQVPADATPLENIQITNNATDNSATKVNVQSTDGTINTISKSDLVNVVEVNDVPSLPLVGEVGKIYVVKNVNKIYRWNGTFYQELAGSDITYQSVIDALGFTPENVANKATALTASSTLYPTNNAVIVALATKEDKANKVTSIGSPANDTNYPSELAVKTYADNLVVGMLNDRGTWDASVNAFPTTGGSGVGGAIRKGDMWYISVAGILGTKSVNVGDSFRALVNTPAQVAANWSILEANIGYVPANDSNVVHLTGTETITGVKTFNDIRAVTNYKSSTNNVIISDTDGFVFRGVRSVAWSDNVNSRFFQVGDPNDNVAFTTRFGAAANRMLFSSLKTQISSGSFVSGIIPLGIFEVTNGTNRFFNVFESGNSVFGGSPDDLTNRLQVTGTVSSGTTALNNTPPTANNQLTRKDYVDSGLALKANLASPSLTGTPTAPTATAGTNTTQIATTAFVQAGLNLKSNLSDITLQRAYDTSTDKKIQTLAISPFTLKAQTAAASDNVFVIENSNGFEVASVGAQGKLLAISASVEGNVTGNFFIKRSTPANNILLAGGGDLAQGTAFNKNFGTTAGTVVEGNDSRLNNGQTAFSWGNHANAGYALSNGSNLQSYTPSDWVSKSIPQVINASHSFTNGDLELSGHLHRSDSNYGSEHYDHYYGKGTAIAGSANSFANLRVRVTDGGIKTLRFGGDGSFSWDEANVLHALNFNSYSPTLTGTGATGNWGINISGLAANSTLWNGYDISVAPTDAAPSGILGYYNSGVTFQRSSATALSSFLGLGSNAYSSTAYLPLSGGTLTGIVTASTAPAGTNTTQIATTAFVAGGLATKENAFTKNTAFNKNFGTTAGTVVEGGTLGSNAYTSTAYLPLSGGTLTGIVTAPTAPAGTNTTQIATTAFVQSNSRPYKVYTALLSQSGTNAPVATVLENTLGGTVVWTRNSTGLYTGTLTGVFTANKTFCTTTIGAYLSGGSNSIGLVRNSVDDVFLFTNRGIAGTDAILNNASIEIRVYD